MSIMSLDRRSFLRISGTGAAAIMAGAGISRNAFAAVPPRQGKKQVHLRMVTTGS